MSDTVEVIVGIVGRAHGIKGEAGIDVRTDEPGRRFTPGAVLRREGGGRELVVESARDHSGRLLVRFLGYPDRTAVETLRGTVLVVDVDAAARPEDEEEYYDRQLTGLRVLDAARDRDRPGRRRDPPAGAGRAGDPDGRAAPGWCRSSGPSFLRSISPPEPYGWRTCRGC